MNPYFQQEITGVGNFSGRTLGFQVLITKPHFLDANTAALEARFSTPAGTVSSASIIPNSWRLTSCGIGYKASSADDDSFVYIDPVTGAQLSGSLKLQQNFVVS